MHFRALSVVACAFLALIAMPMQRGVPLISGPSQAQGSTINTFYYAGAVASEKRRPSAGWDAGIEPVPNFNTGYLRIDTSQLPGQTLVNAELTWSVMDGWEPTGKNHEALLDYNFRLFDYADDRWEGGGWWFHDVRLLFDAYGNLSDWQFRGSTGRFGYFDAGYNYNIDPFGERFTIFGYQYEAPGADPDECYPFPVCIDNRLFRADAGGVWFKDDPLAFAAQVEAMTLAAIKNPPNVIPLPPPALLLIGGLAALGFAARRRQGRQA